MKPNGKQFAKRGQAKIRYLSNIGDNEIQITFDDKKWIISINGRDVSLKLNRNGLAHKNTWRRISRARAKSKYAFRRFTVTKNCQVQEWKNINHNLCGLNYQLKEEHIDQLRVKHPKLYEEVNVGKELLMNQCHNNRDGRVAAASRIVGGKPSPPGSLLSQFNLAYSL